MPDLSYKPRRKTVPAGWRRVLLADPCPYCGAASTQIDHVHAINRGGPDEIANLVGICSPCNGTKRDRTMLSLLLGRHSETRAEWGEIEEAIAALGDEQKLLRARRRRFHDVGRSEPSYVPRIGGRPR